VIQALFLLVFKAISANLNHPNRVCHNLRQRFDQRGDLEISDERHKSCKQIIWGELRSHVRSEKRSTLDQGSQKYRQVARSNHCLSLTSHRFT
jgi:hypothetical protein